jgi:hypothetical protein
MEEGIGMGAAQDGKTTDSTRVKGEFESSELDGKSDEPRISTLGGITMDSSDEYEVHSCSAHLNQL